MILPLLTLLFAFDLATVHREPNLEKRSELAMKNADLAVTAIRDAAQKGEDSALTTAVEELRASVDLAVQSLEKSGARPRTSKYYKKAELAAGQLVRRLDGLLQSTSVVDQEQIRPARDHISEVHDKLLADIMRKKK